MTAESFFKSKGMGKVAGRTYPNTYAIVSPASLLADQVSNRDSASWKKAEHIVIDIVMDDEGQRILSGWRALTMAEPVGLSIQKLYVKIAYDTYVKYDATGRKLRAGTLHEIVD